MRATVLLAAGLAMLAGCSEAPDRAEVKRGPEARPAGGVASAAPAAGEQVAKAVQVIAYYFHGTVRCETCLRIEKQAQELMNSRFAAEVASERLVFKPVNYDEPENAHYLKDYKLPCPSLVLVRQEEGKDQDWKLLGQTWEFVQIPPKLDQYIEEETAKFLEAMKSSGRKPPWQGLQGPCTCERDW